jgi:hypothetical protein
VVVVAIGVYDTVVATDDRLRSTATVRGRRDRYSIPYGRTAPTHGLILILISQDSTVTQKSDLSPLALSHSLSLCTRLSQNTPPAPGARPRERRESHTHTLDQRPPRSCAVATSGGLHRKRQGGLSLSSRGGTNIHRRQQSRVQRHRDTEVVCVSPPLRSHIPSRHQRGRPPLRRHPGSTIRSSLFSLHSILSM